MSSSRIEWTPEETTVYGGAFRQFGSATPDGRAVAQFLAKSGLPHQTLLTIWRMVDVNGTGVLSQDAFFVACRLIAAAQKGIIPSLALVNRAGFPCVASFTHQINTLPEPKTSALPPTPPAPAPQPRPQVPQPPPPPQAPATAPAPVSAPVVQPSAPVPLSARAKPLITFEPVSLPPPAGSPAALTRDLGEEAEKYKELSVQVSEAVKRSREQLSEVQAAASTSRKALEAAQTRRAELAAQLAQLREQLEQLTQQSAAVTAEIAAAKEDGTKAGRRAAQLVAEARASRPQDALQATFSLLSAPAAPKTDPIPTQHAKQPSFDIQSFTPPPSAPLPQSVPASEPPAEPVEPVQPAPVPAPAPVIDTPEPVVTEHHSTASMDLFTMFDSQNAQTPEQPQSQPQEQPQEQPVPPIEVPPPQEPDPIQDTLSARWGGSTEDTWAAQPAAPATSSWQMSWDQPGGDNWAW